VEVYFYGVSALYYVAVLLSAVSVVMGGIYFFARYKLEVGGAAALLGILLGVINLIVLAILWAAGSSPTSGG